MLQDRDLEILKFAFKFRVVTYDQIRRKFFAASDSSAPRRRLTELCDVHLLKADFVHFKKRPVKCVSLTEKGWDRIAASWPFTVDRPHFKSESPEHDLRLAEIHLRFERLSLYADFLSENLLQSSLALLDTPEYRDLINLQADGALALKDNAGHSYLYAVELEISKKTVERYQKKLAAYYRAGGIDGVIYVCAHHEVRDLIAKVDREIRTGKRSIVYLGDEAGVLENQGKMFFKNAERDGIGLF